MLWFAVKMNLENIHLTTLLPHGGSVPICVGFKTSIPNMASSKLSEWITFTTHSWFLSPPLSFFLYKFIYFNWSLITLQYCIGFAIHQHESTMGIHVFPILNAPSYLPPHTIHLGHPSAPAPSILYHASNLDWRFISYMILYMFKCHSSKSSHPLPLPESKLTILTFLAHQTLMLRIWYVFSCHENPLLSHITLDKGPELDSFYRII